MSFLIKRIISYFLFLIFPCILLISLWGNSAHILLEYEALKTISFADFFALNFPQVANIMGIFGVFFSYWFSFIFGYYFSFVINLFVLFYFINSQFFKSKVFSLRLILLFIALGFLNLFLINMDFLSKNIGILSPYILLFINKFLNKTGFSIICILMFGGILLIIFPIMKIMLFIHKFFMIIHFVMKKIFNLFKFNKNKKLFEETIKPSFDGNLLEDHSISDKQKINDEMPIEKKVISPIKKSATSDLSEEEFILPNYNNFLKSVKATNNKKSNVITAEIKQISTLLLQKLGEFSIEAKIVKINIGPVITQFEIEPAAGIKVSRFLSLQDDIALAIKAKSIRIQAPIPGKGTIGIEIPNEQRTVIYLKDILDSPLMINSNNILEIALGKDIAGEPMTCNLAKMPHLLIAGATGAGKSVAVNTIINSLLFRATPSQLRFVMIDPKRIELSGYENIPHLIQSVVTESEDALKALNWGVAEMERRYKLLQKHKVREIISYNNKIATLKKSEKDEEDIFLPYIVYIVDEFADLIMTAGKDIETPIARLAQMARAVGIHLILATQRPSTKVITGVIKANFPARIAFQVSSKIDSRVIIDTNGAEKLLGMGDMLFLPPDKAEPVRIHGAYLSDAEIESLIDYLKTQPKPDYQVDILSEETTTMGHFDYDDDYFPKAAFLVARSKQASVSMLQRHFKIGYARSGRLIDLLEQAKFIGPNIGSKPREVYITEEDLTFYGYEE